ncbi:GTPase [Propionibacteriaceae bacterium G1746]
MARTKGRALPERIVALREAGALSRGRSDDALVDEVEALVARADERLAFSGGHTVVALAGATGSGKSSLFNAIAGVKLAEPGVKRPTTSKAMAGTFGPEPSSSLLDWMDVPRRHVVPNAPADLEGLVLVDLPDHDSTASAHRIEVDRLVELVDMLIWVVDPQKYADAALHDRYLKPLARQAANTVVVLNQADRLTPVQLEECLADLRRLLGAEGLGDVQVRAASAVTGQGVADIKSMLAKVVKGKTASAARFGNDVGEAAARLDESLGQTTAGEVTAGSAKQLVKSLSAAAGVGVVTEAVVGATRRRGSVITGWPALSWLASLRPDPLRRLRLGALPKADKKHELEPARVQRTNIPRGEGALKARVDSAVRVVSDEASQGLPHGWAQAVRVASQQGAAALPDDLDRAVATADLGMDSGFGYWRVIQAVQWVLMTAVILGLGWLLVDFVLAYFQLPPLPTRRWRDVPVQTWLIIGGVGSGLVLGLVSRLLVEITARSKGRRALGVLQRAVGRVADAQVLAPVNAELGRHRNARQKVLLAK